MPVTISRDDLKGRIADNTIVVLEALPTDHWRQGHLPGAAAFPLGDIDGQAAELLPDKSAAVAVYCSNDACQNSHIVAQRLSALGYTDVYRYPEGNQGWISAGLPVESA